MRSLPAKSALLFPRLPLLSKPSPTGRRSSAWGSFPVHFPTAPGWVAVCHCYQPALFLLRACFAYSFSVGVALALIPGVHSTLGDTSPRGLVRLSVFAYYKTFVPVSSVIKVRSPPPWEDRSSRRLAQLIAKRSTSAHTCTGSRHHAWSSPMAVPVLVWPRGRGAACPSRAAAFPPQLPRSGVALQPGSSWRGWESFAGVI